MADEQQQRRPFTAHQQQQQPMNPPFAQERMMKPPPPPQRAPVVGTNSTNSLTKTYHPPQLPTPPLPQQQQLRASGEHAANALDDTNHIASTKNNNSSSNGNNSTAPALLHLHHPDNENKNSKNYSVIASSLISGVHGRERRVERGIDKSALQMARRYGMKEAARHGRVKYTYAGVAFIYDPISNCEITSYRTRDDETNNNRSDDGDESRAAAACRKRKNSDGAGSAASSSASRQEEGTTKKAKPACGSGTAHTLPILLCKKHEYDTPDMRRRHAALREQVSHHHGPACWSSHSVLVIDMSGSMRRDDVNGARCRSDGVWMALARDFVKEQLLLLEEDDSSSRTEKKKNSHGSLWVDVVSVVLMMHEGADIMLQAEPMDWVLYNMFVDFREWSTIKPAGHGYYLPALNRAEELLDLAGSAGSGCALSLLFFSDGMPSDFRVQGKHLNRREKENVSMELARRMGQIAAKFGRRLTVQCIGMASAGENPDAEFKTLKLMVDEAAAYGAIAALDKPRLTEANALSSSIRSLVTSMTQSKAALTNPVTGRLRRVRTDVVREKALGLRNHHHPADQGDTALTRDWQAYHNGSRTHYVQRVWTWDRQRDDFVYCMDPRCIYCYSLVGDNNNGGKPGFQCPDCKACFICHECQTDVQFRRQHYDHRGSDDCRDYLDDRRRKAMVQSKVVPSYSVAMKNFVFGEGVERIVRQFRYLDDRNNFMGPKWVAKESRFVMEENESTYESRMDYHREFMRTQVLARDMAAKFNEALDTLTKHFDVSRHDWLKKLPRVRFLEPLVVELVDCGTKKTFLVEEMLDGRYQKFNNNMGYVEGKRGGENAAAAQSNDDDDDDDLGDVPEEECDNTDELLFGRKPVVPQENCHYQNVRVEDFPQALSHFSYERSKKRIMVVDLQGVLQVHDDGTREYVLTDPAIHKRQQHNIKLGQLRLGHFGRTDRGEKGMKAFWASHVCTDACSLLGLVQEIL